ncbi:TIGR02679 domain-containing protein [Micromonosporaceae bacterium B7E4]
MRATWWHAVPLPASAAERRRALWDAAGVLVDELSSTVLVLNLPAEPGSRLHAIQWGSCHGRTRHVPGGPRPALRYAG